MIKKTSILKYNFEIIISLTLLVLISCTNENLNNHKNTDVDVRSHEISKEIVEVETPALDILFLYSNAIGYLEMQEYKHAISRFSQIININPNLAIAYKGRGAAYYYEGLVDLSKVDLEKAISIDPNLGGSYLYLSMIQYDSGDINNAEKSINKAINLIHPIREAKELEKATNQIAKILELKSLQMNR